MHRKHTHVHTPPLLCYFTRIMLVIKWGAFTGCSHIPVSLCHFLLKLLFFLCCSFSFCLSVQILRVLPLHRGRNVSEWRIWGCRLSYINISITLLAQWKKINSSGFGPLVPPKLYATASLYLSLSLSQTHKSQFNKWMIIPVEVGSSLLERLCSLEGRLAWWPYREQSPLSN